MELHEIDPTKLNFKLECKDLSRQIIVTVTASEDTTFKVLAEAAEDLRKAWQKELELYKLENKNNPS